MATETRVKRDFASVRGEGPKGGPSNRHGEREDGTMRRSNSFRKVAAQTERA